MSILVVQVSPYPPEPGSDYHAHLAEALMKAGTPVVVLAGRGARGGGGAGVPVYPFYWAPRLREAGLAACIRAIASSLSILAVVVEAARRLGYNVVVNFHYGPTTWPGVLLGEHYPAGMMLARLMGARVVWTVHAMLTPRQILEESRRRGLPLLLGLLAAAYYMLVALTAAILSHRIVVLVDEEDAAAGRVIGSMLASGHKTLQAVHPYFPAPRAAGRGGRLTVYCLGYIRREKAYHLIAPWLSSLRRRSPGLYSRLLVVVAGAAGERGVDKLYVELLKRQAALLAPGSMLVREGRLDREEFVDAVSSAWAIWCAYTGKYGPSGILAWARGAGARPICVKTMWGGCRGGAPSFEEHASWLIEGGVYGG